jgi:hypothetical protein
MTGIGAMSWEDMTANLSKGERNPAERMSARTVTDRSDWKVTGQKTGGVRSMKKR